MQVKRVIATRRAPGAIGPYSQAVVSGGVVYCSGQIAIDPETNAFAGGSVEEQTRRALSNLAAVLEAAGTSLANALKLTVYVTDMGDFAKVNEVYGTFFESAPPARATVEVSGLPKGASVEIDCIAAL
jgi:2-iminobutanoate/2-iminopropanoate deaminase